MKRLRIYIDTSVFGGYFDEEFEQFTLQFFQLIFERRITALISETLTAEIANAPYEVRKLLEKTLDKACEPLPLTPEAIDLHQAYLEAGIVARKYASDALHVAQATIARADVIVSWNFKHLVNPESIRRFNGVNTAQGFGLIVIMTPSDVVGMFEVSHGGKKR